MISELQFIEERLAIAQEQLHKGPPDILRKKEAEIAIEKNRYELEMRLLQHISRTVPDGKIAIALRQWKTKFHMMTEEHYRRHKDKFDYYEKWHALAYDLQENFPPPSTPPLLRHKDQFGNEWIIDGYFLGMLDVSSQ